MWFNFILQITRSFSFITCPVIVPIPAVRCSTRATSTRATPSSSVPPAERVIRVKRLLFGWKRLLFLAGMVSFVGVIVWCVVILVYVSVLVSVWVSVWVSILIISLKIPVLWFEPVLCVIIVFTVRAVASLVVSVHGLIFWVWELIEKSFFGQTFSVALAFKNHYLEMFCLGAGLMLFFSIEFHILTDLMTLSCFYQILVTSLKLSEFGVFLGTLWPLKTSLDIVKNQTCVMVFLCIRAGITSV